MPQPVFLPVLLVVASMLTLGCNTPDLPNIPAADSDIQGPAVTPSLLEKARDGRLLFPANGGTNHHHHHKGPDADNVDGGPAEPTMALVSTTARKRPMKGTVRREAPRAGSSGDRGALGGVRAVAPKYGRRRIPRDSRGAA